MKVERFYTPNELQTEVFPGRSIRWVMDRIRAGDFGTVVKDRGGWWVPSSGVSAYLDRHSIAAQDLRGLGRNTSNLVQFHPA